MSHAQVVIFAPESAALSYTDKKGAIHGITAEGALFKGGAALTALKDAALDSAMSKAVNGRYRAAADVLSAAFPRAAKASAVVLGQQATWHSKLTMGVLLAACGNMEAPEKGWSKKQAEARVLLASLMQLPAFAHQPGEVVEAAQ